MTNRIMRDGTLRSRPTGDCAGPQPLTAIAFNTIHTLIRAAHLLKEQGFDVLVAPRRAANCGAVALVASESVSAVVAALDASGISPEEITDYPLTGGAV